ncbi:MAG TPA: diguanylate cyclase [Xanthomonadaceae bacterium]|nr:diguanylate cyclase [Xanthomonadaceae bacterium]
MPRGTLALAVPPLADHRGQPIFTLRILVLFAWLPWAGPVWGDQDTGRRLPLTVDERLAACAETEDLDPAHAIALAESVLAEGAALSQLQRADALGCRGWSRAVLAGRGEARRDAHALSSLALQLPTSPDRVRVTRRAGTIFHRSGDRIGAIDMYARALADSEAQGLEAERIPLLINLGVLHSEFEEHERARVNYEQALALMDRLGDLRHEAPVRYNLGLNLAGQRRFDEALPQFQRVLELIRSTGVGGPTQEISASLALANALQKTGSPEAAQALIDHVRAMDVPLRDAGMRAQMLILDAGQLAQAGDAEGALALLDGIVLSDLGEIQQWSLLRQRVDLLERLGRFDQAAATLRQINELREAYLRHQNHERLAALETHMRDREQRLELERLQDASEEQARRLMHTARRQWAIVAAAGLLLLIGTSVLLWQRRMNRQLDRVSRTDSLTGLANRRDMTDRLRSLSSEVDVTAAVLLIDIDQFKRINDEHGHDAGDRVLIEFARRLRDCVGEGAIVARWGGEEFLVLLPGAGGDRTRTVAELLRTELAHPISIEGVKLSTHICIGYANLPLPGATGADSWHHSLQLADSALYLAKASGRDAWAGYWIERPIPDWPAERLGREARLARSLGVISLHSSRPLRDPLASVR